MSRWSGSILTPNSVKSKEAVCAVRPLDDGGGEGLAWDAGCAFIAAAVQAVEITIKRNLLTMVLKSTGRM
jgi:hypothetical protein